MVLLLFQIFLAFSSEIVRKWSGSQKTEFFLYFKNIIFSIFFFNLFTQFWLGNAQVKFSKFSKIWTFFIGISVHFGPKEHLMAKSTFFQLELEKRVFGLREWSVREKTGFFLNFQNFQFFADLDHFRPGFDLETHRPDSRFLTNFQIDTLRF